MWVMGATHAGWQKPGSIKWQVLTPCIHHKMAQGVTNSGFGGDTCGLAKTRVYKNDRAWPPAYTIKKATAVATAGVPCWHYAALSFSSGLLCFWGASGFFLHEPMWNPCWFHMNINELCNQTSHMGCFNACLLWQKLGSDSLHDL